MPQEVSLELRRVVQRWQQLPLDQAQSRMPAVRELVDALAGRAVPDLGPEVLMDQLTVVVYDASKAGPQDDLGARLAALRRALG